MVFSLFSLEFFIVAGIAVVLVGIIKSGFLGGNALIGVTIMSLYISPIAAIGIFLPLLITMDIMNTWHYRKDWSWKRYKDIMPGAFVGIIIGVAMFQYIDENILRLLIGGFAIYTTAKWMYPKKNKKNGLQWKGAKETMGMLGGLSSFIAHAGAPPIDGYLLSRNMKKTNAMATSVYLFMTINLLKLGPYYWLDLLAPQNVSASIMLLPFVPVGVFAGQFLHRIVSQKLFERIAYIMLAIIGAKLIWDGMNNLI